jgi:glycosyltransferase involved in cell wall biosynthesis
MQLSVVIPCFNEEQSIESVISEVAEQLLMIGLSFEIIPVDDGSTDRTENVLAQLSEDFTYIKPVLLSRNFGKESAMLAGLKHASGEGIIIMDGDGQHPASLIPALVEQSKLGYMQVVGKRDRDGDPFLRTMLSKIYYKIMSTLSNVPLADGEGDFRYLDRKVVDALLSIDERNRFSKGLFEWIGYSKTTVCYPNTRRKRGSSSWKLSGLIDYGIEGIVSFNSKPLRFVMWVGVLLSILSFGYVAYLIYGFINSGVTTPGYLTTIGLVGILGGFQLISISILGEYVGRIYIESKVRPHYFKK